MDFDMGHNGGSVISDKRSQRTVKMVVAKPVPNRAIQLVDQIRALPIEIIRQRIDETRSMSDEELRARHVSENRARSIASAERMAAR